jgi:hypothetical protein
MSRLAISFIKSFAIAGSVAILAALSASGAELTGDSIGTLLHTSLSQPVLVASADEFSDQPTMSTQSGKKKSMVKAGAYSLLLPGLGQRYVGSSVKSKIFIGVETAIWASFISFTVYEGWKEDDMIRFAAERANARLENASDEFLDVVGFYESIDQYNMVGRATDFGTRPYLFDTPENHWRWQSETDQSAYRQLKNRWREAGRRAELALVLAVVNRLASAIDAVRDARKSNRSLDTEFSDNKRPAVEVAINPLSNRNQVRVAVYGLF